MVATRNSCTCCEYIRPENSARLFKNPAPILLRSRVQELLKRAKRGAVLEVGGGCLRNAIYLQRAGFMVSVLEIKGVRERFTAQYLQFESLGGRLMEDLPRKEAFHLALTTFVIETVCDPKVRLSLVSRIRNLLRPDGCLILSARGPSDVLTVHKRGKRCSDGYITPSFTFSRPYTRVQLDRFLRECRFSKREFLHKPSTDEPELIHVLAWKNGGPDGRCDQ
jgi:hypothetical protein